MKRPLFRHEVYEHEQTQRAGKPLAISPLSFKLFAGFVAAVLVAIGCLLYWGTYTNERAVPGYLLPSQGLITVETPQRGTVIARYVHLGDHVQKNQKLYEIALQRSTAQTANVNVALVKQYDSELQGIQSRIALAKQLRASKLAQLESEHHDLKSEYQSLGTQLQTEQAISALTKKNLARYRKLVHSGMVSKSDFQQVQQKMLTQKEGVEEIKKTRIELRTQLDQIPAQLAQAKTDAANEIASLRNQAVQLAQERLQLQVAQQVVVRAPAAGTVSSVMARLGENVVPQTPLVSILPHGSVLEARLLVPTAAIGFVHAGESVRLSYSAFPYEQFGLYHGTVRQVSRSIITPGELDLPVNPHAPYYLIIASLAEPYVRAYGRNLPMTAGMTLSADIVLDREPSTPARTGVIAPPVKRTKL